MTKTDQAKIETLEQKITEAETLMQDSLATSKKLAGNLVKLEEERRAVLDKDGLLEKKNAEIKEWHKRALAAEATVKHYKERTKSPVEEAYCSLESPLLDMANLASAWWEVSSSNTLHFIAGQMAEKIEEFAKIYHGKYCPETPAIKTEEA